MVSWLVDQSSTRACFIKTTPADVTYRPPHAFKKNMFLKE